MQPVPLRLRARKPRASDFEPRTLGEHVLRRRLVLRLTAKEAAIQLRVTAWTVRHWERGETQPPIESVPAIVRFLGYNPFPETTSIPERLLAYRRVTGYSIWKAATAIGVDPTTWRGWERGKDILFRRHRSLIARALGVRETDVYRLMARNWARAHAPMVRS
ncbi:MAG: helix-turn-helix domain-containing protein [Candidatus Tyrphobacter sp.]